MFSLRTRAHTGSSLFTKGGFSIRVTILGDVADGGFKGEITGDIPDGFITLTLPKEGGLPSVSIHRNDDEYVTGFVVPKGYDRIIIDS